MFTNEVLIHVFTAYHHYMLQERFDLPCLIWILPCKNTEIGFVIKRQMYKIKFLRSDNMNVTSSEENISVQKAVKWK